MSESEELGAGDFEVCPEPPEPFVAVTQDGFGFFTKEDGTREIVRRFTFKNQNSLIVQVITYGATITSIKFPDKDGVLDDIVLGFDDLEGYQSPENPHFGAIIGRCANIIARGHFKIGNNDFQLSINEGEHHTNGGFRGFDKVNWKSDLQDKKLVLTYLSKDGEEGYPGELLVSISYEITTENDFIIDMKATASKATPVNLTNHTFFNLGGHGSGAKGLYQHLVSINADRYCHMDDDLIPTGMLKNVMNTLWDLRISRKLEGCIGHVPYGGYDLNYCIHKTSSECMSFVARVVHKESGRTLEVYSNQPGVQFYTANKFPSKFSGRRKEDGSELDAHPDVCLVTRCPQCGQLIRDPDFENASDEEKRPVDEGKKETSEEEVVILFGKDAVQYFKHAGFCLMTQKYPDSVHRKNFPNSVIKPGEMYCHKIRYKFDLFDEVPSQPPEEEEVEIESESLNEGELEEEGEIDVEKADDLLDTKLEENGR